MWAPSIELSHVFADVLGAGEAAMHEDGGELIAPCSGQPCGRPCGHPSGRPLPLAAPRASGAWPQEPRLARRRGLPLVRRARAQLRGDPRRVTRSPGRKGGVAHGQGSGWPNSRQGGVARARHARPWLRGGTQALPKNCRHAGWSTCCEALGRVCWGLRQCHLCAAHTRHTPLSPLRADQHPPHLPPRCGGAAGLRDARGVRGAELARREMPRLRRLLGA
mmetsp:Transcript_7233/g.15657  ORF Transcript_7233/g.15657 Transcript_7233/m.15657 type:complete len:220 (+) Transcript_7233:2-661(+)